MKESEETCEQQILEGDDESGRYVTPSFATDYRWQRTMCRAPRKPLTTQLAAAVQIEPKNS